MDLKTYLSLEGKTAAALAKDINVPASVVSQWRTGIRPVPAEHCPKIEKATGGHVTCEELLPGVDWAFIRSTKRRQKAAA